jgi:hypothetical protein
LVVLVPRHTEPTNGGLVTIRDPTLLSPGQLAFIRNGVYLPGSDALWRARGRSAFGTATASAIAVDGLRDALFDNSRHYLIAHTSASYLTAIVGDTGTFGLLASGVGDGSKLEVVHYRNRFILFNGTSASADSINTNKVMYQSATSVSVTPSVRQHGMRAVEAVSATSTAGVFSQTVTGYYEYWTTEVAKFDQDNVESVVESTFAGDPATIYVSTTAVVPVIRLPEVVNPGFATHWRVYRSPKKDAEKDKKFPSGFMIAELGISTATAGNFVNDSFTAASASSFPSTVNTGQAYSDFANAIRLTADDGSYASATATITSPKSQGVYTFNFGGFTGNIRGIVVEFQAFTDVTPCPVNVRIGKKRQSNGSFVGDLSNLPPQFRQAFGQNILAANTAVKSAVVTAAGPTGQTITVGGATDRWFPTNNSGLVDTDFGANFMVVLSTTPFSGTKVLQVDYVKVTVYYAATNDSVIPFPTVVYTFGDISAQVGKNGPPPSSSTGDLYEDALVVNDVTNPGIIRYSYPGDTDAFPATYYLDFETRNNDIVTNIKTVNGRLMVFLTSSTFRVNYLPSERDASFDRGKAIEMVSSKYGCVNEMCAARYTPEGGPERVAWVSDSGIHSSDGFSFQTLTDNLDWGGERGTGIANLSSNYVPIALVDDPDRENLIFYFRNDLTTNGTPYSALHIHYNDPDDRGKPKASGFVDMRNSIAGATASPASVCPVRRSTGATDIYIGYNGATGGGGGQVYRETGTTLPVAIPVMRWGTRRMFLADFGNEWKLNNIYGHVGLTEFSSPAIVTYQTDNFKTNSGTEGTTSKSYTFTAAQTEKLHRVTFNQMCEGVQVFVTASGTGKYSQEFMIIDGDGFGVEDSGV